MNTPKIDEGTDSADTETVGNTDSPESAGTVEDSENPEKEEGAGDGGNAEETAAAAGATAEADDIKIEAAVEFINEAAHRTLYVGYAEIGNYILEKFFNNDIELASSKNPRKDTSYGKLRRRTDLAIHPSRLGLMVRVASQERFLADSNVDTKPLLFTHKSSLVRLENSREKISVIQECIDNKWTTRELDKRINAILRSIPSDPYETLALTTSKYIKKVNSALTLDVSALKIEEEISTSLPDGRRQELIEQIETLKTRVVENAAKSDGIAAECDALLSKLGQHVPDDGGK